MLKRVLVAAALAVAAPQAPGFQEPSPRAELERLAGLVGELDTFELVLGIETDDSGEVIVELAYAAPDRARLVWRAGEQVQTTWFLAGVLHQATSGPAGASHARFDAQRFMAEVPSVQAVLAAEFPAWHAATDLGPGPVFHLDPQLHDAGQGAALAITLSFARSRPALFCWSFEHRARLGQPTLEESSLLFGTRDGAYFELSREHGFPLSFHGRGSSSAVTLELASLDLNPDLDPTTFEVPVPPAPLGAAQDVSGTLAVTSRRPFTPHIQRRDAYESLLAHLLAGDLTWNADTRARSSRVFRELHRLFLPNRFDDLIGGSDTTAAEEVARILRDHGDHPLDDRTAEVELVRQNILEAMVVVRDRYLEPLAVPDDLTELPAWNTPAAQEHLDQLLAVELAAARALLEETVTGPILASFERRARGLLR